jgi:hypothetical protein
MIDENFLSQMIWGFKLVAILVSSNFCSVPVIDRAMFQFFFFLKLRQKICLNLLIKKKRISQLINGKPGENRVPCSSYVTMFGDQG